MGVFVAFFLTSYFLFSRRMLKSIGNLQEGARIIGSGNLDHAIEENGDDEFSELSRSFNRMTSDLHRVLATKAELEREIAGRKQAEEALKRLAEQRQVALDAARMGWWRYDPITRTASWDERSREIYGVTGYQSSDDGIIGAHVHPEDLPGVLARVEAALNPVNPQSYFAEYRINPPDGSMRWIEAHGIASFEGDGEDRQAKGFVGTVADITERKHAEEVLKESSKKLNLLTSITRHDILNQVTALKAFLVLLEDQRHDEGEAKEMFRNLEKIADTIRRQITFTGDYQDMGERDPEWQQVEWVMMRAAAGVRLNGATLTVDTGSLEIFADPMLEKAFYNLLDNAVVHGERVKNISVSFRTNGDAGVLVFEDDGVGVPASMKTEIFERGVGKVTGYGLFLVKEILDITGMSIRETGEEGKGARFEIETPAGKWRR
jgi:PAS domain S-box-containing protein